MKKLIPFVLIICLWRAHQLYTASIQDLYQPRQQSELQVREQQVIQELSNDDVFHFVHISDLHLSRFKNGSLQNLEYFLDRVLPIVNPAFVLVTGDLTDAKDEKHISSWQYEEEWQMYGKLLQKYKLNNTFWYDQRGNHDVFNVMDWESESNYYKHYSTQKVSGYSFRHKQGSGVYNFVSVDGCPSKGSSRPFNFFGYFDTSDMDLLYNSMTDQINHTFVMSHYPLATTLTGTTSEGLTFDDLSPQISVYLSGHLHRLVGKLGEVMHANYFKDTSSLLELEVGDMKQHGVFRVMSVDNGQISFVDRSVVDAFDHTTATSEKQFYEPVVVLITSPKDTRYLAHGKEPIVAHTHVRFLAFSQHQLVDFQVTVDGQKLEGRVKHIKDNIFELPLNFNKYQDTHLINVTATDSIGKVGNHQVIVNFARTPQPLDIGPGEWILHMNISHKAPELFWFAYFICTFVLLLFPKTISVYLHHTKQYYQWRVQYSQYIVDIDGDRQAIKIPPRSSPIRRLVKRLRLQARTALFDFRFFVHASIYRMVTLASLPATFYPLLGYALYIIVGPYFVGELVPSQNKLGQFYVYGIYLDHKWIPVTDTYVYGMFELMYIFGPLIVYLSFCITPAEQLYAVDKEVDELVDIVWMPPRHNRRNFPLHRRLHVRLIIALVALYQLNNVFFIGLWYGPVAVVLSPGKTWFVAWCCYALYKHRWSSQGNVEVDLQSQ